MFSSGNLGTWCRTVWLRCYKRRLPVYQCSNFSISPSQLCDSSNKNNDIPHRLHSFKDEEESYSNSEEENIPDFRGESVKELFENSVQFNAEKYPKMWFDGAYPKRYREAMEDANDSRKRRVKISPEDMNVIIFPGQGSQFVGMGSSLIEYPNVKEMYNVASEILGYDLLKLSVEGPIEQLNKTIYQQPAIFVSSLAVMEKVKEELPYILEDCVDCAGYSLGEITALTFAGCFKFEDALELVKVRAEAMQLASDIVPSGMSMVHLGADSMIKRAVTAGKEYALQALAVELNCKEKFEAQKHEVDCKISSFLYPSCKVISGNMKALKFIEDNRTLFKIRTFQRIRVSGAFHSDLMKVAVEPVKKMLDTIEISPPLISVRSNFDGTKYRNTESIKTKLLKQLYNPIKWEQIIHNIYSRSDETYPRTFICGPNGNFMKNVIKKINAQGYERAKCINA